VNDTVWIFDFGRTTAPKSGRRPGCSRGPSLEQRDPAVPVRERDLREEAGGQVAIGRVPVEVDVADDAALVFPLSTLSCPPASAGITAWNLTVAPIDRRKP